MKSVIAHIKTTPYIIRYRAPGSGGRNPHSAKHVLVVKMALAITVCFFISNAALSAVFIFHWSNDWVYLVLTNNLCNPVIYYWLNKEFRREYNDFWKRIWKKIVSFHNQSE